MPLYEYECTACHKRTEKIQKFSEPEITVCPKCSGVLERVLSAPAISFKGGGWFADGYGNAKPNAAEPKEGGSTGNAASGSGNSEGKTSSDSSTSTPAAATASAPPAAPVAAASSSSSAANKS